MFKFFEHAAASWKTTLGGLVFAVGNLSYNGVNTRQIFISALVAWLGAAAKDANVTGGDVQNTVAK